MASNGTDIGDQNQVPQIVQMLSQVAQQMATMQASQAEGTNLLTQRLAELEA
jgi:hypothetical protein